MLRTKPKTAADRRRQRRPARQNSTSGQTLFGFLGANFRRIPFAFLSRVLWSVPSKVVLLVAGVGLGLVSAKSSITKTLSDQLPKDVFVWVPEQPGLQGVLDSRLRDELAKHKKKTSSRVKFIQSAESILLKFPALESATFHSQLNGGLRISARLHQPTLELRDQQGKRFLFGRNLKLVGSSTSPDPDSFLGLAKPPLVLTLMDTQLRWDQESRSLARLVAGRQASSAFNLAWHHRTLATLNSALDQVNEDLALQDRVLLSPPGAFYYNRDDGFSFCLIASAWRLRPPKDLAENSSPHCTKFVLGEDPRPEALRLALAKLAPHNKGTPPPLLIDLRISGRAILRSDALAEGPQTAD
jgi:hypothetical protein